MFIDVKSSPIPLLELFFEILQRSSAPRRNVAFSAECCKQPKKRVPRQYDMRGSQNFWTVCTAKVRIMFLQQRNRGRWAVGQFSSQGLLAIAISTLGGWCKGFSFLGGCHYFQGSSGGWNASTQVRKGFYRAPIFWGFPVESGERFIPSIIGELGKPWHISNN